MAKTPRQPRGIRARVKDAQRYERDLRRNYLLPLHRAILKRLRSAGIGDLVKVKGRRLNPAFLEGSLAQAAAARQALQLIDLGITDFTARPLEGIPTEEIQRNLTQMANRNRNELISSFNAALGVDISRFLAEAPVREYLRGKVAENAALIKTIPKRLNDDLRKSIQETFEDAPFDEEKLSKVINQKFDSSGYNLRRITRDQTSKVNGNLTKMRHEQCGITKFIWSTSLDDAVRPECAASEGIEYEYANPPGALPGERIQCFPAGFNQRLFPLGFKGGVSYSYSGDIVHVVFGVGDDIAVTPNHPILTERGWIPAKCLQYSDKVVVHKGLRRFTGTGANPNIDDVYPLAENLHRFFGGAVMQMRSGILDIDLHSGVMGGNENIDVVLADRVLRDKFDSAAFQFAPDLAFMLSNIDRNLTHLNFDCVFPFTLDGVHTSPRSKIGGASEFSSLQVGQSFHTDDVGFRPGSWGEIQLMQAASDYPSIDSQFFGYSEDGIASLIHGLYLRKHRATLGGLREILFREMYPHIVDATLNEILRPSYFPRDLSAIHPLFNEFTNASVKGFAPFKSFRPKKITVKHYDGPVFNYETDTGIIVSNGIITHNCRCVAIPVVPRKGDRPAPQLDPVVGTPQPPTPKRKPKPRPKPKPANQGPNASFKHGIKKEGDEIKFDGDATDVARKHRQRADFVDEDYAEQFDNFEEYDAIMNYRDVGYKDINEFFVKEGAGYKKADADYFNQRGEALKSVMKPLSEDYRTYRGITAPPKSSPYYDDFQRLLKTEEGDVFESKTFSSSSGYPDTIGEFGVGKDAILMEIEGKKGAKALVYNIEEMEVLYPPGTKFKILDKQLVGEKHYIRVGIE